MRDKENRGKRRRKSTEEHIERNKNNIQINTHTLAEAESVSDKENLEFKFSTSNVCVLCIQSISPSVESPLIHIIRHDFSCTLTYKKKRERKRETEYIVRARVATFNGYKYMLLSVPF